VEQKGYYEASLVQLNHQLAMAGRGGQPLLATSTVRPASAEPTRQRAPAKRPATAGGGAGQIQDRWNQVEELREHYHKKIKDMDLQLAAEKKKTASESAKASTAKSNASDKTNRAQAKVKSLQHKVREMESSLKQHDELKAALREAKAAAKHATDEVSQLNKRTASQRREAKAQRPALAPAPVKKVAPRRQTQKVQMVHVGPEPTEAHDMELAASAERHAAELEQAKMEHQLQIQMMQSELRKWRGSAGSGYASPQVELLAGKLGAIDQRITTRENELLRQLSAARLQSTQELEVVKRNYNQQLSAKNQEIQAFRNELEGIMAAMH